MGPELDTARSSRSQRSLEASAHIKREALAFLADSGADLMSTKSLAERSGISTGPIYARYDIIEDLVLDLWVETLHAEFLSILSLIRNAVNENATEREELARLLHTPSTKAQAIVDYRNSHGAFKNINDLDNVTGIGPATISKISAQITL